MAGSDLFRYAGWAAYLSAVASIATSLTAMLFFTRGQPWGTVNDLVSIVQMLFALPLVPALHRILASHAHSASLLAACIGAVGMLAAALLQILLVLGRIEFRQQIRAVMVAGAAIGLWLLLAAVLSLSSGALPGVVAWLGLISGLGYVVTALGYFVGGQESRVFRWGAFVVMLGFSLWAIVLGRVLLSRGPT